MELKTLKDLPGISDTRQFEAHLSLLCHPVSKVTLQAAAENGKVNRKCSRCRAFGSEGRRRRYARLPALRQPSPCCSKSCSPRGQHCRSTNAAAHLLQSCPGAGAKAWELRVWAWFPSSPLPRATQPWARLAETTPGRNYPRAIPALLCINTSCSHPWQWQSGATTVTGTSSKKQSKNWMDKLGDSYGKYP